MSKQIGGGQLERAPESDATITHAVRRRSQEEIVNLEGSFVETKSR
jgi:hypothetical protein